SGGSPGAPATSQTSPTRACGPSDSISSPTTRTTRPMSGVSWVWWSASKQWSRENPLFEDDGMSGIGLRLRRVVFRQQRARELAELRLRRDVHEAEIRMHVTTAAADGRIKHDLHRRAVN